MQWRSFALKALVSVGLVLYLVHRTGGWENLFTWVRAVPLPVLLWAWVLYFAAVLMGSVKWGLLLRAQGLSVPWRALVRYTLIGAFFNNLLPANVGGDVVRGYGLAQHTRQRTAAAISVVMDRLVGLLAFLTMAALAGTALLILNTWHRVSLSDTARANVLRLTLLAWVTEGSLLALMALMLSRRLKRRVEDILQRMPVLHRGVPFFHQVAEALNAYRHAYQALLLGGSVSWGILLLTGVETWLLAQALVPEGIPFLYVMLVNPLIAFALLLPFSIGGLGIGQTAYIFFFGLLDVAPPVALALSLLHQGIVYTASLPGALVWLRAREQDHPLSHRGVMAPPAR